MTRPTSPAPSRTPSATDSPAIVFSHGNSFPGGTYSLMLDSLRRRGFAVTAIDKYGHDPRFPVTNNWPHLVEQLVDHVGGVVNGMADNQSTNIDAKVWLVGHSLGGFVSLMAAAQHPEIVHGVVMLDSPIVGGWRANALQVAKTTQLVGAVSPGATSRKRRQHWPDRDAALSHFQQKRAFAKWHPQVLADYISHGTRDEQGQRVLSFDRDIETAIYNTLPHNVDALLKRHPLKVPLSFIGGTQSAEMKQVGMTLTQRLTRGRVAMLEGTHLFPMEKPLATAAAIEAAILAMQGG